MVLKRRLDYGFNGYQMPFVPRASRSARGKGSIRKKAEDNQIRAFELLATVATKLLQDRKSSALPNATNETDQHPVVKNAEWEEKDIENPIKLEPCDQKSCAVVSSPIGHHQNESDMTCFAEKLTIVGSRNAFERSSRKVVGDSYGYGDGISQRKPNTEPRKIRSMINGTAPDTSNRKDLMKLDMEPPALISSDNCVKASFFKDPNQSLFRYQGGIKVVSRDDDENSCRCSQRAFRQHIGDRRIRKLLAPIYRRVASNSKDRGLYYTDGKLKPIYRNWKSCYTRQRYQKISPFRRRKLFDRNPLSKSNQGFSSKGIYNFPEKGMIGDNSGAGATSHARGASSSVAAQHVLPQSEDYNVKLSINSFIVPELLIELPATATIGSLKRTVMEAVTAILGDRLHVGILLQGQKVRDDNKTLLQTGISQDDKLHTLGFILEPQDAQIQLPLCTENRPFMLPDVSLQGLTPTPLETNLSNCVSRLDIIPPLPGMSTDETVTDSKALVAVPALAAVPFHHKPRCPQFAQRRTRRPFSISEVEALVHSVEKFGTGRWRDVKLCAFDNATHRTYVDLKDKWKTLVHTAKISPQQRRGEPVPQELLDRVLAAHAFWSRQRTEVFPSLLNNTDKAHVERWD